MDQENRSHGKPSFHREGGKEAGFNKKKEEGKKVSLSY